MSRSRRLCHAALGGCVATFLLVSSALGQAPDSPRALESEPAAKNPAADQRAPDQPKTNQPQRAAPAEQSKTANGGGNGETSESYYKEENLKAQREMAGATDSIVRLTRWQIGLGVGGTILLLWTLWETRRATNLASDTAQRQLRAYVGAVDVSMNDPGSLHVSVTLKNTGATPAHKLAIWHAWESGEGAKFEDHWDESRTGPSRDLFPGETMKFDIPISFKNGLVAEAVMNRKTPFYCWGGVSYFDAFGHLRKTQFRCELPRGDGVDLTDFTLIASCGGNYTE